MSPLRRWMEDHGHPGWWSWLVVVGSNITTLTLCVAIALTVNERSIERERMQRQASERAWCGVINIYTEAAKDPATPAPTTKYGREILAQMVTLGQQLHCERY